MKTIKICTTLLISIWFIRAGYSQNCPGVLKAGEKIFIDSVWSGHPVNFDLLTTQKNQYVIYYNAGRQMVIGKRGINEKKWSYQKFNIITGWDSHNYVTLSTDTDGYLHVSGNMHGDSLIYFRSVRPEDISAFEQLSMVGKQESEVTYPVFFKNADGTLYFQYRDGMSGNGVTLWNRYRTTDKKWIRVNESGLFNGENEASAYPLGPVAGPDGYFHMIWMWRLTPNANTNHNLSYMKSKDLTNWVSADNKPLEIPIRWNNRQVFADAVGPWNGLINMNFYIWFDNQKQPVITYHRYNSSGISQIFALRYEDHGWKKYQLSHWETYTWDLNKYGSIESEVRLTDLSFEGDKAYAQYYHKTEGYGVWVFNPENFELISESKNTDKVIPEFITNIPVKDEKYQKNYITDNTGRYVLVWQTLGRNRDRPRSRPYPGASGLYVYCIKDQMY